MSPNTILVLTLGVVYGVNSHSVQEHKTWQLTKGILVPNSTIMARTLIARSLTDCMTKCAMDPSFASIYYEKTSKQCYCNHNLDFNPIISSAGQLVYGYPSLSYEVETSYDDKRNVSSKSSDWIVFQRRQDGSVDFLRPWLDYVNGFGNSSGELWLGLEKIHQITKNNTCELNITMEAEPNHPLLSFGYAHYDRFNISGADDNYRLYVSGFSGNVVDCFSYHSGHQFTTTDADHDTRTTANCAVQWKGAWWYGNCYYSNLNGQYNGGTQTSYGDGVHWSDPWGEYYSLIKVEMNVRCLFEQV